MIHLQVGLNTPRDLTEEEKKKKEIRAKGVVESMSQTHPGWNLRKIGNNFPPAGANTDCPPCDDYPTQTEAAVFS